MKALAPCPSATKLTHGRVPTCEGAREEAGGSDESAGPLLVSYNLTHGRAPACEEVGEKVEAAMEAPATFPSATADAWQSPRLREGEEKNGDSDGGAGPLPVSDS